MILASQNVQIAEEKDFVREKISGIFFVNTSQDVLTKKMPTEKPEIFSGFLRFSPFSSLFQNSN